MVLRSGLAYENGLCPSKAGKTQTNKDEEKKINVPREMGAGMSLLSSTNVDGRACAYECVQGKEEAVSCVVEVDV
jgi:imidazole glycerol phosphate synthase subunit HisF